MNDSAVSICVLKDILIDPDFESVCPPLTEEEFSLLEQNILSDGEVTSPLIVWNNKLIDGHHRRQIILKHPELPFQIKEVAFNNKYEAIAWICKNQAGRRNLTSEQLSYLICEFVRTYDGQYNRNTLVDALGRIDPRSISRYVKADFDHPGYRKYVAPVFEIYNKYCGPKKLVIQF